MNIRKQYFTTEQVSKWHPDKYADQISDAFVSYITSINPNSKVAIETLVKDTTVVVAGETTYPIRNEEVYNVIHSVSDKLGYEVVNIINLIGKQSIEINKAVEQKETGAGDQGIMFGYATKETKSYLPLGVEVANKIIEAIEYDIEHNKDSILKGDAKCQVTILRETGDNNKYQDTIDTILVSACHKEKDKDGLILSLDYVRDYIKNLVESVLKKNYKITTTILIKFIINPSGLWTIGGPLADSGLTGRKIVCDQYGGYDKVGGGAFSGKDFTKVDRSAAYYCRNLAIDLLNEYPDLTWVRISVSYAIGQAYPMSIEVENDKDIPIYLSKELFKVDTILNYFRNKKINLVKLSSGCHYRFGKVGE